MNIGTIRKKILISFFPIDINRDKIYNGLDKKLSDCVEGREPRRGLPVITLLQTGVCTQMIGKRFAIVLSAAILAAVSLSSCSGGKPIRSVIP